MAILSPSNDRSLISTISLKHTPWLNKPFVADVFQALDVRGHVTRVVGGAVRNAVLGVAVADVDMATTLKPDEVIAYAGRADIKAIPTGIAHGTVTLVRGGEAIEVTTLRADIDTDGRHATVVFGSDWCGDAGRRDFTVNALYCNASGEVFDPLGGMDDVVNRRIRFIGDPAKRISEDYLRILRFIRFHGAYGKGAIDRTGLRACVQARAGLGQLSKERIWSEFSKILVLDEAIGTVDLMFAYGLLLDVLGAVPRLGRFGRVVGNEKELQCTPDAVRRLGALTLFTPDDARSLAARFRLSRHEFKRLEAMVEINPLVNEELDKRSADRALYRIGRSGFKDRLLINCGSPKDAIEASSLKRLFSQAENWISPVFPIDGEDLQAFGISPGPEIGRLLKKLEAHWVEADFSLDRRALFDHLRDLA